MNDRLLSIDDVALQFNVSSSTVRRWVRRGELIGNKAGRQWRFNPDAVRKAFEQGMLSGASRQVTDERNVIHNRGIPEWANTILIQWRSFLENQLNQLQPDHVVVNDRRGAKIWKLLMMNRYVWGKNLWHSTAIELMTLKELRRIFQHRRVLLFDEMMQHGREIHELRDRLEAKDIKASVTSVVCVRKRSHAESGELLEYETHFCEDLDDMQFGERAALISRLSDIFEPPLDADHLVVKGNFIPGLKTEELLEKSVKWGIPFIVWFPDQDNENFAITLDRPQFFDTNNSDLPDGFSIGWDGPVKIRIYGNPENGPCYCSFVVHPDIEAPISEWVKATMSTAELKRDGSDKSDSGLLFLNQDETVFRRFYSNVCINLATRLFNDFVISGVAEEIGIHFDNSIDVINIGQIHATFGPTMGSEIERRVRGTFAHITHGKSLFPKDVHHPPSLFVRKNISSQTQKNRCHIFECRAELLKAIPERYLPSGVQQRPVSWSEILNKLSQFTEPGIGEVFDDELDRGKVKPLICIDHISRNETQIVRMWRGFCRGEFGPWFEWNCETPGHEDLVIQRTLGLGPMIVESFLKRIGESQMISTHFDKIFSNLQHDLCEGVHDLFYLAWRPYKYGPVPVVPVKSPSGEFMEFQRFLTNFNCLKEIKERHGSQIWRRYEPGDDSKMPWRMLYKKRTSSVTRAYVASLVRFYAAIQSDCTTKRPPSLQSPKISLSQAPLTVLAAARNEKVAYICGWFEVHDWISKGKLLFAILEGIAIARSYQSEPFLKEHLKNFAEPARLLFDKIEMYRNLPYLRQQIVDLFNQGDFEVGEVLLESIDSNPRFESQSEWPMRNLEWACRVMRAFSSMTRQVLTKCGLDIDTRKNHNRKDDNGLPKDSLYYLSELLTNCPELKILEADLRACIESISEGCLTENISGCIARAFRFISDIFDKQKRIPDPRPQSEKSMESLQARNDLMTTIRGIAIPQPHAIAIADIRNFRSLPGISDIFGTSYEEAMNNLLSWFEKITRDVIKHHSEIHFAGRTGDSVVLAGHYANELFLSTLDLIKKTARRLSDIDYNQFAQFGLLRAGIAWCDDEMDKNYQGVRPGLIAHELANISKQPLGVINCTKEVFGRLSPEYQNRFKEKSEDCGQGNVFIRYWEPDRDSK